MPRELDPRPGGVGRTLAMLVAPIVAFLAIPLAPLWVIYDRYERRRQGRRLAQFAEANHVMTASDVATVEIAGRGNQRIELGKIQRASWEIWGDGTDGLWEVGLSIDGDLRLRAHAGAMILEPLVEELQVRGLLTARPPDHLHPDESVAYLVGFALIVGWGEIAGALAALLRRARIEWVPTLVFAAVGAALAMVVAAWVMKRREPPKPPRR